jgi:hypothetical protein
MPAPAAHRPAHAAMTVAHERSRYCNRSFNILVISCPRIDGGSADLMSAPAHQRVHDPGVDADVDVGANREKRKNPPRRGFSFTNSADQR